MSIFIYLITQICDKRFFVLILDPCLPTDTILFFCPKVLQEVGHPCRSVPEAH